MPPDLVRRVLASASADVVLVGGQALAYWMGYYGIHAVPAGVAPVTRDVDFFTPDAANAAPLQAFARAIGGRAEVRDARAISALVGSAVAPAEAGRVYNVDLVHQVVGLQRDNVAANAITVQLPEGVSLRVMHPVDVMVSRSANLHQLPGKQDDAGRAQLQLAIEVVRHFLEDRIDSVNPDDEAGDREVHDVLHDVLSYAHGDVARRNAERHDIHLADAIPAWRIGSNGFWERQWPHLRLRMSPAFAALCEQRAGRGR